MFVVHPSMGVVDILASRVEGLKFAPAMHVFYGERMIDLPDDLPKFLTMPAEMGGDGKMA